MTDQQETQASLQQTSQTLNSFAGISFTFVLLNRIEATYGNIYFYEKGVSFNAKEKVCSISFDFDDRFLPCLKVEVSSSYKSPFIQDYKSVVPVHYSALLNAEIINNSYSFLPEMILNMIEKLITVVDEEINSLKEEDKEYEEYLKESEDNNEDNEDSEDE